MVPIDVLLAFVLTTCGFMLIPGPAMLYTATVGVDRGRRAGIAAASGLALGDLMLATAAALGLTAVLAASETLFAVLKVCGVAFLVYLGVRRLMTPMSALAGSDGAGAAHGPASDRAGRFRAEAGRGVLVSMSNPKDALFFFAFLPQFTSAAHGSVHVQMLVLGCVFALIALVFDGAYGALAAGIRPLLVERPRIWRSQRWVGGAAYLLMAAIAAVSPHRARAA